MAEYKILVVDDEEPIANILEFNLKKEGYDVIVANDLMLMFSFIYSSTTFFLNSKLYLVIKIPTSKKLNFLV